MMKHTPEILAARYILIQEHQAGGMATVYKARDYQSDRSWRSSDLTATSTYQKSKQSRTSWMLKLNETWCIQTFSGCLTLVKTIHGRPFVVLEWIPCNLEMRNPK